MKEKTGYPSIDKLHNQGKTIFQRNQIIPSLSIYNLIFLTSMGYKNANAINCMELTTSYKEMLDNANTLAKAFKELGLKKGDILTVTMPNYTQAVEIYLAANKIGVIVSFLNYGCNIDEIKYYLNEFNSPVYINYNMSKETNEQIKKGTNVKQIITLHKEDVNKKTFNEISNDLIGYNDLLSYDNMDLVSNYYKSFINPIQSGKNDSLILFTSGSTGNPKSVVLTNENLIASGLYMKNTGNIVAKKGEKCLICVPFSYPYGFATSTLMSLMCGREAILTPNMEKGNTNYYLSKNPNYIFGSPAVLELIKRTTSKDLDLSSIHSFVSGGDFLSAQKADDAVKWFNEHGSNIEIYNGSGNAETAGASTIAVGSPIRRNTVGKILTGSVAIILKLDAKGNIQQPYEELKYGEEGLLCIRGKHVFKEYYNNPELTKANKIYYKDKEYLNTGAIGFIDTEGYFHMNGRASRFYIKSDSNKVYLEHLQIVMGYLDCIDECVAVSRPNEEELYDTKVYVKLKSEFEPNEYTKEYILEQLKTVDVLSKNIRPLKSFEFPASIEFVDEIRKNPDSEKLDYRYYELDALKEYEKNKALVLK